MKYDVFISYSRKDINEVYSIIHEIKKEIPDLKIWFDLTGIDSGDKDFEDTIIKAIDNTSYVLFALSDNSLNSKCAKEEIKYALNTEKRVIPLMLKGAKLKGFALYKVGPSDCIDFTDVFLREKLLSNLSKWTGKERVAVAEPVCPCGSGLLFKDCHGRNSVEKILKDSYKNVLLDENPLIILSGITDRSKAEDTSKTWRVGDYYHVNGIKGVVFWVDKTGRHGKIVSLDQTSVPWYVGQDSKSEELLKCESEDDGYENMNKVMKVSSLEKYPAFQFCASHGKGWYLPSFNELRQIFQNPVVWTLKEYSKSHPANHKKYWSSSEASITEAYTHYRTSRVLMPKTSPALVRAVYRF